MSLIQLTGENGAEIYFDRDQLPAGIAKRIARGDLTEIKAEVTAGPDPDGETDAAAAVARITELEAEVEALKAAASGAGTGDPAPDPDAEPDKTPPAPEPDTEQPTRNASQAAWAEYAVTQGMSPDEANAASRADLIAQFAAPPAS